MSRETPALSAASCDVNPNNLRHVDRFSPICFIASFTLTGNGRFAIRTPIQTSATYIDILEYKILTSDITDVRDFMSDNSDFIYLECNDDKKPIPSGMHIAAIWEGLKKPYR